MSCYRCAWFRPLSTVFHHDTDGGIQIWGHSSSVQRFKMMLGKGSLHGEAVQDLKRRIEQADFYEGVGTLTEAPIFDHYIDYVVDNLNLGPRRLKVVVDGGNGTGGPPAVALLNRLGVDVVERFIEMDGTFPNHHPDPTVEHNLQDCIAVAAKAVLASYDGDAELVSNTEG